MKKIGIDINETIRGLWLAFHNAYEKEFDVMMDDTPPTRNFWKDYKWEERVFYSKEPEELSEDFDHEAYTNETDNESMSSELSKHLSLDDYSVGEKNKLELVNLDDLKDVEIRMSPREVYENFIDNDNSNIFLGALPHKMHAYQLANYLHQFVQNVSGQYEITFFSKESFHVIPMTLGWYARFPIKGIRNYKFYREEENPENIVNDYDVIITTDSEILSLETDKTLVRIEECYNKDLQIDLSYKHIKDLVNDESFLEKLNK